MGTTSEKLTYLNTTKGLIKDNLNLGGANISTEPFRAYSSKLKGIYKDFLANGTDTLWNNWEKVNGENTSLSLSPTIKGKMKIDLKGNAYQYSTTGKNYFNPTYTFSDRGVTATIDNQQINFNGTSTQAGAYKIANANMSSGTYTISLEAISGTHTINKNIWFDFYNGNTKIDSGSLKTTGNFTKTFSTNITSISLGFDSQDAFSNYTFRVQIESGNSATKWEEYTGNQLSPNPDYPQDIQVVSGDNTIEICGKNLFDKANVNWYRNNNTSWSNTTDINTTRIRTSSFKLKGGKTYTISGIPSGINFMGAGEFAEYGGANIGSATVSGNTFTLSANANYVFLLFGGSNFDSSTNTLMANANIQIEANNEATTYEAYTGNSQLISLGVENLFDKSTITTGKYIDENGTLGSSNNFSATNYIKIIGGNTYTYSGCHMNTTWASGGAYYDNSKNFISSFKMESVATQITPPNNASFVRFSLRATENDQDTFMLEKGSKANSYSPYGTTPIELCKIGEYQDYIYKEDDKWYLHKEIGKVVLDGSENWIIVNSTSTNRVYRTDIVIVNVLGEIKSNYFVYNTNTWKLNDGSSGIYRIGSTGLLIISNTITTLENFKVWLSTHNTEVYYVLANPTTTEITDTNLIEQLNDLEKAKSYNEQTNVSQVNNDLAFILDLTALKEM